MLGRFAVIAACAAVAACAGLEPAGRNAARAPAATPTATARAPTPPPSVTTTNPAPVATPPATPPAAPRPPTATPPVTTPAPPAPAPTAPAASASDGQTFTPRPQEDTVVVPGQRERQVTPPQGDPRSTAERMEDVRAWDRCVMRVQSAFDSDPMRPQLESPEEVCSRSLGMSGRTAIPLSRQERRR